MANTVKLAQNKKSGGYHLVSVDASNNIVFDYGALHSDDNQKDTNQNLVIDTTASGS